MKKLTSANIHSYNTDYFVSLVEHYKDPRIPIDTSKLIPSLVIINSDEINEKQ